MCTASYKSASLRRTWDLLAAPARNRSFSIVRIRRPSSGQTGFHVRLLARRGWALWADGIASGGRPSMDVVRHQHRCRRLRRGPGTMESADPRGSRTMVELRAVSPGLSSTLSPAAAPRASWSSSVRAKRSTSTRAFHQSIRPGGWRPYSSKGRGGRCFRWLQHDSGGGNTPPHFVSEVGSGGHADQRDGRGHASLHQIVTSSGVPSPKHVGKDLPGLCCPERGAGLPTRAGCLAQMPGRRAQVAEKAAAGGWSTRTMVRRETGHVGVRSMRGPSRGARVPVGDAGRSSSSNPFGAGISRVKLCRRKIGSRLSCC